MNLGQVAYHAYGDNREWKDWRGGPMPTWDGLNEGIRTAWEVAANAASEAGTKEQGLQWSQGFTERERKEIEFSRVYKDSFAHGTDGHNAKLIVAKMADILDANVIVNLPPQKT